MSGLKTWIELRKQNLGDALKKVSVFLQTPFGATAAGGLVVVVIAKLLFG